MIKSVHVPQQTNQKVGVTCPASGRAGRQKGSPSTTFISTPEQQINNKGILRDNSRKNRLINKSSAGFTLLMAVLVASIGLALGAAILNITLKSLYISAAGRNSNQAFYAADTGLECALYWDIYQAFATSTRSRGHKGVGDGMYCNGQDVTLNEEVWDIWSNNNQANTTFGIEGDICAVVTVYKANNASTTIESRGYNTCNVGDPRRTERGIRTTY